jgi:hypothetical protein
MCTLNPLNASSLFIMHMLQAWAVVVCPSIESIDAFVETMKLKETAEVQGEGSVLKAVVHDLKMPGILDDPRYQEWMVSLGEGVQVSELELMP